MPWDSEQNLADQRAEFVEAFQQGNGSMFLLCKQFGISRKTGYKWLERATQPRPQPLRDRSRRPDHSPNITPDDQRDAILDLHSDTGWGPRKIRALLLQRGQSVPSLGAVQAVLRRAGRVHSPAPRCPPQRFERAMPNLLWQIDFKGPLDGPGRSRSLLSIIDDHSRYLLALRLLPDQTMASAWEVIWEVFGNAGLPVAFLSDNGFAPRGPATGGLSWLEAQLIRLGVRSIHGRPYHPQTQGKVERFHGTLEQELLPRLDWTRPDADVVNRIEQWRTEVYNAKRPHEGLGNATPSSRWYPSERVRPGRMPELVYPSDVATRKVMSRGEISWEGYELKVGAGLAGERVGVKVEGDELVLLFGTHELRRVPRTQLVKGRFV